MAKKNSIEDYIKKHMSRIAKISPDEKKHSYEAKTAFSGAIANAISKKIKESAEYGTKAESLATLGLSNSGYADYINSRAAKKAKEHIDSAASLTLKAIAKERENAAFDERKILELQKKLISYTVKNDVTDKALLYDYAKALGIDKDRLDTAVSYAISENENHKRTKNYEKVHSTIVYRRLTRKEAYEYAISLGLSEEDSRNLADMAYKINEDTSKY